MTVLRALAYFEFDFPLNFYTCEKLWNKYVQKVHKNDKHFLVFFFVFGEITDACIFFSTVWGWTIHAFDTLK